MGVFAIVLPTGIEIKPSLLDPLVAFEVPVGGWRQNMRIRAKHSLVVSGALVVMAAVLCSLISGCSSSGRGTTETKVPAGAVALAGAGSTFDSILFNNWFTIFQHDHSNAYITYDVVG